MNHRNYRQIIAFFSLLLLFLFCMCGCRSSISDPAQSTIPSAQSPQQPQNVYIPGVSTPIYKGITIRETVKILGAFEGDYSSTWRNRRIKWILDEGVTLTIVFVGQDAETFWKKYHNREFVLPDEVVETTPQGIPYATPNEQKVMAQWLNNMQAVSAIVTQNGKETKLF